MHCIPAHSCSPDPFQVAIQITPYLILSVTRQYKTFLDPVPQIRHYFLIKF